MSEMTSASKRSTGPTGSDTGWPLMTITLPNPRSPNRGGFSARNAPYRMQKRERREAGEDEGLDIERLPEDLRVAERGKPERVDVVGDGRAGRKPQPDDQKQ